MKQESHWTTSKQIVHHAGQHRVQRIGSGNPAADFVKEPDLAAGLGRWPGAVRLMMQVLFGHIGRDPHDTQIVRPVKYWLLCHECMQTATLRHFNKYGEVPSQTLSRCRVPASIWRQSQRGIRPRKALGLAPRWMRARGNGTESRSGATPCLQKCLSVAAAAYTRVAPPNLAPGRTICVSVRVETDVPESNLVSERTALIGQTGDSEIRLPA